MTQKLHIDNMNFFWLIEKRRKQLTYDIPSFLDINTMCCVSWEYIPPSRLFQDGCMPGCLGISIYQLGQIKEMLWYLVYVQGNLGIYNNMALF